MLRLVVFECGLQHGLQRLLNSSSAAEIVSGIVYSRKMRCKKLGIVFFTLCSNQMRFFSYKSRLQVFV